MHRFIIFSLVIIGLSCSQKNNAPRCENFKLGFFYYYSRITKKRFFIERHDNTQTEQEEGSDTIKHYRLKWTGDCEYNLWETDPLKLAESLSQDEKEFRRYVHITPLETKITATGKNYYLFHSRMEGIKFEFGDTIWYIKPLTFK
jgi:hypothetical protein